MRESHSAAFENTASLDDAGQPAAAERLAGFLLPGIAAKTSAVLAFQRFGRSHDACLQAGEISLECESVDLRCV